MLLPPDRTVMKQRSCMKVGHQGSDLKTNDSRGDREHFPSMSDAVL
jgi:hypothetical protein